MANNNTIIVGSIGQPSRGFQWPGDNSLGPCFYRVYEGGTELPAGVANWLVATRPDEFKITKPKQSSTADTQ